MTIGANAPSIVIAVIVVVVSSSSLSSTMLSRAPAETNVPRRLTDKWRNYAHHNASKLTNFARQITRSITKYCQIYQWRLHICPCAAPTVNIYLGITNELTILLVIVTVTRTAVDQSAMAAVLLAPDSIQCAPLHQSDMATYGTKRKNLPRVRHAHSHVHRILHQYIGVGDGDKRFHCKFHQLNELNEVVIELSATVCRVKLKTLYLCRSIYGQTNAWQMG